ncbi:MULTISPECIES: FixH family protein [unclassified Halomonas]|uniref:FixH family protein n=1 Tax=unclassified Halomonas TaxID=2609666 RepID=UPI002076B38A|nr:MULTISPECIES: FixH family protein [unclassified Halomonas]
MFEPAPPPWYRQFWPWCLLTLLLSSMLMSVGFAVVALKTFDGMVVQEDYFEHGKAINAVLEKVERAEALGLSATLYVDPVTQDVVLELEGQARPKALALRLIHPTRDERDVRLTLTHRRGGHYVGQAPTGLAYRRYVTLTPSQAPDWRLNGEITLPSDGAVRLAPARAGAP